MIQSLYNKGDRSNEEKNNKKNEKRIKKCS